MNKLLHKFRVYILLTLLFVSTACVDEQISAKKDSKEIVNYSSIEKIDLSQRLGVQEMVVSVQFLDDVIKKYQNFADFELLYRGMATKEQVEHLGLKGNMKVEQAVLRAHNSEVGFLRLLKFHNTKQVRIRSSARPFDTGGIFNLNLRARNMEEAFEEMRENGFIGFADPTYYDFHGKRYGGAMLRGHDGVVINLLTRVSGDYSDAPPFDRISHIINSTQMIGNYEDYEKNKTFYEDKLGWVLRFEGSPTWPEDGSNNMSLPNSIIIEGKVKQRAAGFTYSEDADGGSIEIFAFDGISGEDFSDRAHPPNLGVLMYRAHVEDIESYAKTLADKDVEIVSSLKNLTIIPYGETKTFIVKTPTKAWIEFFEQQ